MSVTVVSCVMANVQHKGLLLYVIVFIFQCLVVYLFVRFMLCVPFSVTVKCHLFKLPHNKFFFSIYARLYGLLIVHDNLSQTLLGDRIILQVTFKNCEE